MLAAAAGCSGLDPDSEGADATGREEVGDDSAAATATGRCRVTGCSGQVCADQPVVTTCEWKEEYACYRAHGICERDARGQCGFRPTPELAACLRALRP
ncbi:hypothetical protein BE08_05155 [Sorangium cellulosum]|uniref:Uncharacterized protein n=1 Tax=Sorangium cellulosum TaxID=56 RepID=A0A150PAQ4_SORCE|nr:hypothetical protein BE08_05155 [Sorangium cellulosum]